jgi:hypothetical protein
MLARRVTPGKRPTIERAVQIITVVDEQTTTAATPVVATHSYRAPIRFICSIVRPGISVQAGSSAW